LKKDRIIIHIASFLMATVLTVVLVNWLILPRVVNLGSEVLVPDLRGLHVEKGRTICASRNLVMVTGAKVYDPAMPVNHIHSQNPPPGRKVKRGRKVYITCSLGMEEITLPELRSLSTRQALISLERLGLYANRIIQIYSDNVSKDRVIGSEPAATSPVFRGYPITLLVSRGTFPEVYIMPDLVGKPVDRVKSELTEQNLTVNRFRAIREGESAPGIVQRQYPLKGSRIERDDAVEIIYTLNE
jgi:serine/threonine-protein kinase